MATTSKGVPYPALDGSDANDVPVHINAVAAWVDEHPGVSPLTTAQRDALTGVGLWDGRVIFNLTTSQVERYDQAAGVWRGATVSDHGTLSGLGDDDHPQYLTTGRHDTTARHGPTVVDHGQIGGLGDDDHPHYLRHTRGTLTGYRETVVTLASSGAVSMNLDAGNVFRLNPTGSVTLTASGGTAGVAQPFTLIVGSSAYSLTWPAGTRFPYGQVPQLDGETWISGVRDENGALVVGAAWSAVA